MELSAKVRDLIQKARIVSFSTWQNTHPSASIALLQAADDGGRYLSDGDLQQIQALAPASTALIPVATMLRDRATDIVDAARSEVLAKFPAITEPGGGLHPPARAEACWRDFWHFLRCITYGIVGQHTDYTSAEGLHYMQLLYQELHVPLDAMVVGLEGVKAASLKHVEPDRQAAIAPYFDRLIDELKKFR
ncbi:hypothetical protein [Pseudanabaena sp. PCC 6802]|uniref:hypothetical protein n=1 Tax=Pseudanabaena sp. PCC 6802 TaxID=118173 RepID=UPI000345F228|nr:hypothetical protein [Pseudanabaena sp. PCC 6802]